MDFAVLRIEFRFSRAFQRSIEKARRGGEKITVDMALNKMVSLYSKQIRNSPQMLEKLKQLDPNVTVKVTSLKLGGRNGSAVEDNH